MIAGSDPRRNQEIFVSKDSHHSVTKVIEIREDLDWFDGKGKLTLIDTPGLSDSAGEDQKHLDQMAEDLKKIPVIDIFVMMLTGDRLANDVLIQNMKIYEALCGGRPVWDNIIIIIPKKDFNPTEFDEEDWHEQLKTVENNVNNIIYKEF